MTTKTKTEQIAELNDLLRTDPQKIPAWNRRIVRTCGVDSLSEEDLRIVMGKVRNYKDFSEENDPYQEHDFGSFSHKDTKYFWKIDYYAPDMMHGSENPADLSQTVRVLTIMLANEY